MKKILSVLLSLILVFGLSANAFAAEKNEKPQESPATVNDNDHPGSGGHTDTYYLGSGSGKNIAWEPNDGVIQPTPLGMSITRVVYLSKLEL